MPTNTVQDRSLLAGLRKGRQANLQWLNTTVPVGNAGQFTEINLTGFTISFSGNRLNITSSGGGSQAGIQWQDEGTDLGTPGTVDTVNFVGSDVVATRIGNVVTVTVTGGGSGTVTSVNASGGTTGLSFTGGPVTTSGTLTLGGTLALTNGGTGATTALGARQNLNYAAGLSFRLGRPDGAVLLAGFQRIFLLPASYDQLTTGSWEIVTYPGSTCKVDIQYLAFGTTRPTTANSIVGGTYPQTTGSVTATGSTSGWSPSTVARGDYIAIQIISNDLAREVFFFMPGRKI